MTEISLKCICVPFLPFCEIFWMCNRVRYIVGTDNFASLMTWRRHSIETRQLGVVSTLLVLALGLVGHVGPSQFWVVSDLYCLCGLRTACRNIALCYPLAYFNFPLRDSLNLKGWKRARNRSSITNSSCHWSCGPYLSWGRELLSAFRGTGGSKVGNISSFSTELKLSRKLKM